MFDPINIDSLTDNPDELNRLADVFAYLSAYSRARAKAAYARRQGHIKTALTAEHRADAVYVLLPNWARW